MPKFTFAQLCNCRAHLIKAYEMAGCAARSVEDWDRNWSEGEFWKAINRAVTELGLIIEEDRKEAAKPEGESADTGASQTQDVMTDGPWGTV